MHRSKVGTAARSGLAALMITGVSMTALMVAAPIGYAAAQTQDAEKVTFAVPGGALENALLTFGRQANLEIVYPSALTAGKTVSGLNGTYLIDDALTRLLAGTGLAHQRGADGSVTIYDQATGASDGTQTAPVVIESRIESATGPVEGYVAKRSISGTKTNTALKEIPQSISVVTADQIEDQAAGSVAEAMRYTPGVLTEYRGTSNLHDEMFVRGFSYVPRYVDGLNYGLTSLGQIDPYLLERVELLRGPSSVLFGQANPGGVVNLTTKRPTGETKREVEVSVGTDNLYSVGGDISGVLLADKGIDYRVVAKGLTKDEFGGEMEQNRIAIAPSVSWTPNEDTMLVVNASYQNDPDGGLRPFLAGQGTLYPTPYGYFPRDFWAGAYDFDKHERTQFSFGYSLEHAVNDVVTLRQNARYNDIESTLDQVILNSIKAGGTQINRLATHSDDNLNQYVVDNQAEFNFDTGIVEHKVLGGLDYKYQLYEEYYGNYNLGDEDWRNLTRYIGNVALSDGTNQETESSQTGLYLQDQIKIDRLNVVLGLRHDWAESAISKRKTNTTEEQRDHALTGRAGVIYNFDNGISPFASYSTSFEPASGTDSDGNAFDPVEAEQYEGGIKYAPDDGQISVTATVYQLTQENIVTYDDSSTKRQIGEIRGRGFEFEVQAEVTPQLSVLASYSRNNTKITDDAKAANIGLKVANMPEEQATLWSKYSFDGGTFDGLAVGGGVRYTGVSTDSVNAVEVPDYTLFDAMLSYDLGALSHRFDGMELQLNANNLLDDTYVASCTRAAWACWYGPGRTVTATLRYNW
ncbi:MULTISPECIES: TonB-dependent siderophore receptor [Rhodospirillales]|uniref:TonB-dependent siderophore receptor n=1 Tax=Rhodospirillales TaxID=204441 RepID=UPI003AA9A668